MSREIKFRAWDGEDMISPDYVNRNGYAHWIENSIPCGTDLVMQYTGNIDKNGVEVYEGDIDKYGGIIEWLNAGFVINYNGIETIKLEDSEHWLEIIGNIYQNPELL